MVVEWKMFWWCDKCGLKCDCPPAYGCRQCGSNNFRVRYEKDIYEPNGVITTLMPSAVVVDGSSGSS